MYSGYIQYTTSLLGLDTDATEHTPENAQLLGAYQPRNFSRDESPLP